MTIPKVNNQDPGKEVREESINPAIERANEVPHKVDKVPTAVVGNAAVWGAGGVLLDSGVKPGGGEGVNVPEWDTNTIYPLNFVIQFDSRLFASKIVDNQGNEPPIGGGENTYWRETSESQATSTPLWEAGQFISPRSEVYRIESLVYKKYVLTVTNLPFESTDFAAELLNGDWQEIGGNSNFKGWFADETALTTAYPVGQNGWYAIVGDTDTFWTWDTDTVAWVDTGSTATGGNRIITQSEIAITAPGITDIPTDDTVKTFAFDNLVATQTFTVSALSDTEEKTVKRILDNSANSVPVLLTWPTSLKWSDAWPATGPASIAANSIYRLEIQNEGSTTPKGFATLIPQS